MNIPSVGQIEIALDSMNDISSELVDRHIVELKELGPHRVAELDAALSWDFSIGYMLGLQTMRMMIRTMTPGGDPKEL